MKEGDSDHSPPGTPEGLGNVDNPLPGDDSSEENDPYGEAYIGGSRLENIPQLIHRKRIGGLTFLLVHMRFHCLTLLSAGPISEPLVLRILMFPEGRRSWWP